MLPYLRLEYPLLFLQVLDVPNSIFDYGSLVQLNLVNKKNENNNNNKKKSNPKQNKLQTLALLIN